jgi:predicted O-methyltransferase YrrM
MVDRSTGGQLDTMVWSDDEHLQIGYTRFHLGLDRSMYVAESTSEEFVLLKNRWIVENTITRLPPSIHNMIELGIFKGGSVALYEEIYSPRRLIGIDIETDRVEALDDYLGRRAATDRVRLYYGIDQNDRETLKRVARENFKDRILDLVVDDASHRYEASRISLNVLLPLLRPGGIYLLEDWAWAHWSDSDTFQANVESADSEEYSYQKSPMSQLVFEAVMLAASHPGLVADVWIDSSRAFLTRGPDDIGEGFDMAEACRTGRWNLSLRARRRPIDMWRQWIPYSVRTKVSSWLAKRVGGHAVR